MKCPHCAVDLQRIPSKNVYVWVCAECGGGWFNVSDLEEVILKKYPLSHLPGPTKEQISKTEPASRLICPICQGLVGLISIKSLAGGSIATEACTVCHGRWLSGETMSRLKERNRPTGLATFLKRLFAPSPRGQGPSDAE